MEDAAKAAGKGKWGSSDEPVVVAAGDFFSDTVRRSNVAACGRAQRRVFRYNIMLCAKTARLYLQFLLYIVTVDF